MQALSSLLLATTLLTATSTTAQIPVLPPQRSGPSAAQTAPDLCPLTITIDASGRLYDSRFGGLFRVSEKTLRSDIGVGCQERGATSSVRVKAAPQTKFGRVKEVLDLIRSINANLPVTLVHAEQGRANR